MSLEEPGGAQRNQDQPGGARRNQEPGRARKRVGQPGGVMDCQGAERRKEGQEDQG